MRSTSFFATALAFAASAFAQTPGYAVLSSPSEGQTVPSGKVFNIKWDAGSYTGKAVISLLGGETPTTLIPGGDIATVDVTDGSFAWNVDCKLGKEKTYGIKVASVDNPETFQYSFPFAISGPSCSSGAGEYPTLGSTSSTSASGYVTIPTSSSTSEKPHSTPSSSSAPSYPTASSQPSNSTTVTKHSSSTSAPAYPTVTPSGNLSTTAAPPTYTPTTVLTSTSAVVPVPSGTTSAPATVPTAGASNVAAGSLALLGGLAFAVLGM